jgi:hypothetical protein
LTPLGTFHTAISLIAVVTRLIDLVRDKQISPKNLLGKLYVALSAPIAGLHHRHAATSLEVDMSGRRNSAGAPRRLSITYSDSECAGRLVEG